MNEPVITLVGNLTADPELRFTPGGQAVANFTVAQTPRTKQGDQWVDGEAIFMRCNAWRELAENVAESLTKGMRVVVTGRMLSRSWETKEGEKRTSIEVTVDEVGPSLRWAQATVRRAGRNATGGGQQYAAPDRDPWARNAPDPWTQPAAAAAGRGDEPPF